MCWFFSFFSYSPPCLVGGVFSVSIVPCSWCMAARIWSSMSGPPPPMFSSSATSSSLASYSQRRRIFIFCSFVRLGSSHTFCGLANSLEGSSRAFSRFMVFPFCLLC